MARPFDAQPPQHSAMMKQHPKITFGMIVLNGEPFTRYNMRALYPFAHQIIVVEGACPAARQNASADGHSLDGTLEILREFKANEDPENKVVLVTAEDEGYADGFWPGEKDEQSRAYAKRASGEWLWQVDVDEFYLPHDIERVCREYLSRPDVSAISFKQIQFWGGLDYFVDGWYLRHRGGDEFHRLFRWGPGFSYAIHRPPTVVDEKGRNLRELGWMRGRTLAKRNIRLYHYSLVFPMQVQAKSAYYSGVAWGAFSEMSQWAQNNYQKLGNPYRVHNTYEYPSWLETYTGTHPPQILQMWTDIQNDTMKIGIVLRDNRDIQHIVNSKKYFLGKMFLKVGGSGLHQAKHVVKSAIALIPENIRRK